MGQTSEAQHPISLPKMRSKRGTSGSAADNRKNQWLRELATPGSCDQNGKYRSLLREEIPTDLPT
jgi:hypothetical protein